MCGIVGYCIFGAPKSRGEFIEVLINALKKLEYRGPDSAGKYKLFIFRRFLQF